MANRIYLCLAHMSEAGWEKRYIQEAFDTNWVVPLGPNVDAFEEELRQYVGHTVDGLDDNSREIVALSSGTAAVHLGLLACGVGPGDEVLVQSFTFCASTHPIKYLGATPVMIDSEPETWNMDPALLEQAIQERIAITGRKPKAIVPVYLYGMPAKIDEIMSIAERYDIPVVEDAAEGFGATQAREAYPYYHHEAVGYNYRMSNICAGIGRGQMKIVHEHIAHHRRIAETYKKAFANVDGITFHDELEGMESNFWLCTILLDQQLRVKGEENAYRQPVCGAVGGAAGLVHSGGPVHTDCEPNRNVEAMRLALDKADIESRPLWKPMHKQPVYRDVPAYVNGVSENLFHQGLCLPSGPMVSDADLKYIIDNILENIE